MSDVDGMDAFNRLLERVEELSGACTRSDIEASSARTTIREHERMIELLKRDNAAISRFERFVESTPERQADWQSFISPPKPGADEIPF